jgi:long-chain acyl-CoA synthetase
VPAPTPRTVPDLLLDRVAKTPDLEAFRYPAGDGWESLSWKGTLDRVRAVAAGLLDLGLEPEQRCAILSGTRIEWILADLGILCGGGATTTIYPSSTAEECAFILSDSGSTFAFADGDEQVMKLQARRSELPGLRHVVTFDGSRTPDGFVLRLSDLEERGRAWDARHPGRFDQLARAIRPDSLATLIYTSGTTGRPKGVELTHDCWVYEGEATEASGILPLDQPLQFFWLPLAHSFGKVLEAAQLKMGFATAIDGRVERLVENLAAVRPAFVCAVPRVFEKVRNKVLQNARDGGPLKQALFRWAMGVGLEVSRARQQGSAPGPLLALQHALADRLVFQRIRSLFGGKLRFFISGSAPLARDVAEFFDAAGVLVLEGYGLTESSAASFCNRPERPRIGTVGPPFPGTEVRIAPDGEVLLRGRCVMRGYHNLPEATRDALEDGWLHTGDIGQLDDEGRLAITDRKKDLIKTSGGKYVAPQELEGRLKALSPFMSQVLVHGDKRNYVTALVTLDAEAVRTWSASAGLSGIPLAELSRRPEARALVQKAFDELNASLPRFATVKKFTILPGEFTEQNGEVTASQKLKRKLIEQRYREALDAMYARNNVADVV